MFEFIADFFTLIYLQIARIGNEAHNALGDFVRRLMWAIFIVIVMFVWGFSQDITWLLVLANVLASLIVLIGFYAADALVALFGGVASMNVTLKQAACDLEPKLRQALKPMLAVALAISFLANLIALMGSGYFDARDMMIWGTFTLFMTSWVVYSEYNKKTLGNILLLIVFGAMLSQYLFPQTKILLARYVDAGNRATIASVNRHINQLNGDAEGTYARVINDSACITANDQYPALNKGELVKIISVDKQKKASNEELGYGSLDPMIRIAKVNRVGHFGADSLNCFLPRRFLGPDLTLSDLSQQEKAREEAIIKQQAQTSIQPIKHAWQPVLDGHFVGQGISPTRVNNFAIKVIYRADLKEGDMIYFNPVKQNGRYLIYRLNFAQGNIDIGNRRHEINNLSSWKEDGLYVEATEGDVIHFKVLRLS
ncbi:MAG: hypothetical protein NT091_01930 [Candidatus Falkowbacteria bacterium]|nr:hypothetical protein [Candidatus Falkowbacteria bacterium]